MSFKFIAIELKGNETPHDVVADFFVKASGLGLKFKSLEPYGTVEVGSRKLLRLKTDCTDLKTMLPFFQEDERSYVFPTNTGYVLHTQTAKGVLATTTMQAAKLPGYQRCYRGTAIKFWERQFSA